MTNTRVNNYEDFSSRGGPAFFSVSVAFVALVAFFAFFPSLAHAGRFKSGSFIDINGNYGQAGTKSESASFKNSGVSEEAGSSGSNAPSYHARSGTQGRRPIPARINDLEVVGVSSYSVTLEWTAPAGDWDVYLSTEDVTRYILRYSTEAPILTHKDFQDATEYSQNWIPKQHGSTETHIVYGLDALTTYYFVVESQNQHCNRSERSFCVSTTTLYPFDRPVTPVIAAVYQSSITVNWGGVDSDGYVLEASTGVLPNKFAGNKSSSTPNPSLLTLHVMDLSPNTTYFLRVGALWPGGTAYALTTPVSTATLTSPVRDAQIYAVFMTSVTLNWLPHSSTGAVKYIVEASTTNFDTGEIKSSATLNIALSTLTVSDLSGGATYYFRVKSFNWNDVPTCAWVGSTITHGWSSVWNSSEEEDTRALAWGDFDNDGDLDIAAGNYGANRVYRNDGNEIFTSVWNSAPVNTTRSIAWADFDSDGDLDIAAGNDSQSNKVYRNNGDETFSLVWNSAETEMTMSVAWGDFDNDGDLDLAVGNNTQTNRVYLNDGDETFVSTWNSAEEENTRSVAWADFDNDGDLDIAAGNNGQINRVYENNGDQTFTPGWDDGNNAKTYNLALGDFNNDGLPDIASGNWQETNRLYENNGDGSFTFVWNSVETDDTTSLAWGDFNNDGIPDLAAGNAGQSNHVYVNTGTVNFQLIWSSPEKQNTSELAWGDFDSDGRLDLADANRNQTNRVYRGFLRDENSRPFTAGGLSAKFDYGIYWSTITFKWNSGDYDSNGSTQSIYYAIAAATVPMQLSVKDFRITYPSSSTGASFTLAWTQGSPLLGHYLRPAYQVWPGDGGARHGVFISTRPNAGAILLNTTYYFRVQSIDPGLRQSTWSAEYTMPATPAVPVEAISANEVFFTSVSVRWNALPPSPQHESAQGYLLQASTAPDFTGTIHSSDTHSLAMSTLTVGCIDPLSVNTTYYFRVASLNWNDMPNFAQKISTSTLANHPAKVAPTFTDVYVDSMSVAWGHNENPVDITTYIVALTTGSSYPNEFGGNVSISTTPGGLNPAAALTGLTADTTYYLFVEGVNHNNVGSGFVLLGSTSTLAEPPSNIHITGVFLSSMTLAWSTVTSQGYLAQASSTNFGALAPGGVVYSSVTLNPSLLTLTVDDLDPNTTYYGRVGAYNWNLVPNYAFGGSSSTLANPVTGAQLAGVFITSVTVNWIALPPYPPAASSETAEGYVLQGSTEPGFVTISASSVTMDVNLSTLTASNLKGNVTYYFRVGSLNWVSVPNFVFVGSVTTVASKPINPVIAEVYLSSITVNWGGVDPDGGYIVEASTGQLPNEFAGNKSSSTPNPSFLTLTVEGLDINTTYYLRVGAVWTGTTNYAFTSPASTATLASQPGWTSPPFLEVWTSSISAQWTSGANPDGTLYVLEASSTSFIPQTVVVGSNTRSTSAFAAPLLPNTTYSFRVTAMNHNSVPSAYLDIGSTSTLAVPPSNILITGVFLSSMTISWSTVSSKGYLARVSSTNFGASFPGGIVYSSYTLSPILSTLSVDNLDPNTTYYVHVGAYNWNWVPNFASGGSSSTLANPVTGVQFADVFITSVTLTWIALPPSPPVTSSATAEGYRVDASTEPGFVTISASSSTADVNLSALTVSPLNVNTTYYFRVAALNWDLAPNFAPAVSTATLANQPGWTSPPFLEVWTSSISAQWTNGSPPNSDGTLYVLEASSTSFASGTILVTSNTLLTQAFAMSLLPNTTYSFKVRAINHNQVPSPYLTIGSTSTLAEPPSNVLITEVFQNSMKVAWSTVSSNGYMVQACTSEDFTGCDSSSTQNSQIQTLTVIGLVANTTYYVRAGAYNWNSVLTYRAAGSSSTLARQVTSTQFADVFFTSVTVSWPTRPPAPQEETSEGYLLEASTATDFTGTIHSSSTHTSKLGLLTVGCLAPLELNTTYHFRVGSLNWDSTPNFAAKISTSTLANPPAQAVQTFTAVHTTSMTVAWGHNDNPVGITTYTVVLTTGSFYPNSFQGNASTRTAPGPSPMAAFTGLDSNTTYYLFGEGVNHNNVGSGFAFLGSTSTLAWPVTGTQIYAVFMTSVTVNWNACEAGPGGAWGYVLQASTSATFVPVWRSSLAAGVDLSTLTAAGLLSGTTYWFRVGALNWNNVPTFADIVSTRTYGWGSIWASSELENTLSLSLGDFDNDGDLDIAAGNSTNQTNRLYRNDGDLTFSSVWNSSQELNTYSLAWGDFDNDGDLDIAAGNYSHINHVYQNDGSGGFTSVWNDAAKYTTSIAWGDFDNDGLLDLAAGNAGQSNPIYRNNGDGTFESLWNSIEVDNTYALACGDFDSDGLLDIMAGNNSISDPTRMYKNNGDGSFEPVWNSPQAEHTRALAVADFDNDGDMDIAAGNDSNQTNRVYRNDGNNTFVSVWNSQETKDTQSLAWADFDNDGLTDLVAGNYNDKNNVYQNNGNGIFTLIWKSDEDKNTAAVAWADFDNDGKLEIASANKGQANRVYRGVLLWTNQRPKSPSGLAALFEYGTPSSTITFKWDAGSYDTGLSSASIYYRISAATEPMTLSSDRFRVVHPSSATVSSFTLTWTDGSPLLGHYLRPAYKKWNDDALPKHGVFISSTPNAGEVLMNTTYYFRVQSIDSGLMQSTWSVESELLTLALPVTEARLHEVFLTSVTVNWKPLPVWPQWASAEGYDLQASTAPDFTGTLHSSSTRNVSLSTLTVGCITPLSVNTTYYFRVASLNWKDEPNFAPSLSTSTLASQPGLATPPFLEVWTSSISAQWTSGALANPDGTLYILEASSTSFTPEALALPGGATLITSTSAFAKPLLPDTTYSFRVRAINHDSVPSAYRLIGSTSTLSIPPSNIVITKVFLSSMTLSWSASTCQGYLAQVSSTNFGALSPGGVVYSSVTLNPSLLTLTVDDLYANTTYYGRVGAYNWNLVPNFALGGSSSTLANPVTGAQFVGVFVSSAAVTWTPLPPHPPAASSETAEGYVLEASTAPGFAPVWSSSRTLEVALSTLTVPSLEGGVTYYFRVGSLNWASVPNFVFVGSAPTAVPKPIDPLVSKVHITSIAVNWTGVNPDYGYVLEASTGPLPNEFAGNKSSSTPNPSLLTLHVVDLVPNTTYYLRAGAVWTYTTSYALTVPASTSTLANQPGPATPPFLEVWTSSISAQWTKGTPQNPDGTPYVMEASSTSFTPGTMLVASNTQSTSAFAMPSLLPNTTYSFRVKAINHNSVPSAYLNIGSTSTLAFPPSNIRITDVFSSSMTLSWSTVSSKGYLARVSSTNFGALAPGGVVYSSVTLNPSLLTLTVNDLYANTTYYVKVGAYNWNLVPNFALGAGSSTLANPVTGIRFAGVFISSVTLTWIPLPPSPPVTSSATAEGYRVEASTGAFPNAYAGNRSSETAKVNLSTLTVSSLESGVTYYFRVGSLNWVSVPNFVSAGSTQTIWMGPQNPLISAVFQSSITATWGSIGPDGGYVLEASTGQLPNEFAGNKSSSTPDISLFTLTVEGLSLNTTYYLQAGAIWSGATCYSLTTPASTSTLTSQPGTISPPFLEVWTSSISAQWTSAANPDGTLYVLEASSTSFTPEALALPGGVTLITSTSAFAAPLLPDTTYSFRVKAVNHNSVPSAYLDIGSTSTLALPPSNILITEVFSSSMTLSWGASTCQGYLAQVSSTNFGALAPGGVVYSSVTPNPSLLTLTVDDLYANTTYYVKVGAYNWNLVPNFALGGSSSTLANPVTGVQFAGVFVSSIAVSWTPLPKSPPVTSSATALGYVLEASTKPGFVPLWDSSSTTDVDLSTLTISGLDPGVTYYFHIGSLNWVKAANFVFVGSTRTTPAPINPVISTVYLSSIAVDWTGVNPDLGYVLEASTGVLPNKFAGNKSSSTPNPSLLTLHVVDLVPNTTYYLRVGAVWADATFYALTTPVSTATLANRPGQALPPFLEVWTSSISAQWTSGAPANPDGTLYVLEASSTSFTPQALALPGGVTLITSTSAFAAPLSPDTTYSFRVKAINHNSVPSAYRLIGSTSTLALAPTNVLITDVFSSSMTLSWSASTCQGYLAQVSSTNFGALAPGGVIYSSVTPNPSLLTLTVDDLYANTTYYARVGAYNWNLVPNYAFGGSSSTLANPVTQARFAGVFASSVSVTWTPLPQSPPVTSSATALGYVLESSTGAFPNSYADNKSSQTTDVNLSTLTIPGLLTGGTYYFRVGSLNQVSVPNFVYVGSTITIAPAPANPVISAVYLSSIAVNWTKTNPDPDYGYVVEASTSENFAGIISSVTPHALPLTLHVMDLVPNTTYFLRVGAIWSGTTSYALTTPVSTATLASRPGQAWPPFLEVWTSSISAQWTSGAPANPDGTLYVLEASSTSFTPEALALPGGVTLITSTSAFAAPLLPDTTYSFRVKAVNHNQAPSAYQIIGSTSTLAEPPSNVLITDVFLSSMTLSWNASTCQGYLAQVSSTNFGALAPGGIVYSSSTLSPLPSPLTIDGLDSNTTYYVKVGAYNWNSVPNFALGGSSSTLANQVTGYAFVEVDSSYVTLTWTPLPPSPPVTSSATAEGYRVDASTEPGFVTISASSSTADVNLSTLTVPGLTGRTTYYFRVGALNWDNAPNFNFIVSTRTPAPAPIDPVILAVYRSSITAGWTGVSPDNGYVIEASSTNFGKALPGGIVYSSSTADVNLSTLTVGISMPLSFNTTYYLKAGALWPEGTSYACTTPFSTSTLANVPGSAVSTFTLVEINTMTVAWAHNGNPVNITSYTVVLATSSSYPYSSPFNRVLSTTPQGSNPVAQLTDLLGYTTYYLFIEAVNHNGIGSGFVAFGSTRTLIPVAVLKGFQAEVSSWGEVTLEWNDLPQQEKDASLFDRYRLRRSTEFYDYHDMELGDWVADIDDETDLFYVDKGLEIGTTYWYQLSMVQTTGLEFGGTELLPAPMLGVPPKPPFGVNLEIVSSTVTISWLPPAAYSNDRKFKNVLPALPADPGEVLGYRVYRATAPRGAPWTCIEPKLSTVTFKSTATVNSAYYYHVKAENCAGLSMASMIRSVGSGNGYIVAEDGWSMLEIPKEYLQPFVSETFDPASTYALLVSSHPEDLGGRVLKSLEFAAFLAGGLTSESMKLAGMASLHLHYEKPGTLIVPSVVSPTPENISVYWHNGTKYVQLYGKLDLAYEEIVIRTSLLGSYQIRSVERLEGFAADRAGLSNRLITPNNDGKNDRMVFKFANPRDSVVTGKIYDLKGAFVADMTQGPVADRSLEWDAKSNGQVVPGGVYIFQIEGEGKLYNGTIVVIK